MNPDIYILFDELHRYLGELFTEGGKFSHLTLTPTGEQVLGAQVEEWQLRGIPAVRDIMSTKHDSSYTHDGRVLVRDPGFVGAFRAWLATQHYRGFPMSVEALDCWEAVLALPLEPDERVALAEDLSMVPLEELGAWKRTLQDAAEAARMATV